MTDRDGRIREEAYRVWVERGRPEGGEQDHWLEAERRVEQTEDGNGGATHAGKAPRPARVVVQNAGNGAVQAPKAVVVKPKSAKPAPPGKGAAVDVSPAKRPANVNRKPATKPKA